MYKHIDGDENIPSSNYVYKWKNSQFICGIGIKKIW